METKICDNCRKEIDWTKSGFLTGRIHYNKEGLFTGEHFDYDFCSKKCLKELLIKEGILE